MATQRQARTDRDGERPLVCIFDASIAMTGALMAARRQAALLGDRARFILLVPAANGLADADLPEFERVVRLPIWPLRKRVKNAVGYFPALLRSGHALRQTLASLGCQRLQVNDFYLAQAWAARRLGYRGRIVTWVRTDPRRFGAIGRWWLARAQSASDTLVSVSHFICRTLPTGMTAEVLYDPAPTATTITPNGGRFAFVGNYVEGKGQDVAIAAFKAIAGDYPSASLVLHGSTMGLSKNRDYLDRLKRAAASAGRIALYGFEDDLHKVFNGALAAVNCSNSESFSLTCQEASAHGLPVIATRSGGPEEIVDDGKTGFLINIGDFSALAERMRFFLDRPDEARRMGAAGAALMRERFGADQFKRTAARLLGLQAVR